MLVNNVCVVFTRLPTGHGHGDDDAAFGNVKRAIMRSPLFTWSPSPILSKRHSRIQFKLNCKVEDIYLINDWQSYFKGCISSSQFSNLHKERETQHQWMFQAAYDNPHFPMGFTFCKSCLTWFQVSP